MLCFLIQFRLSSEEVRPSLGCLIPAFADEFIRRESFQEFWQPSITLSVNEVLRMMCPLFKFVIMEPFDSGVFLKSPKCARRKANRTCMLPLIAPVSSRSAGL
jgi:hypothetical protein